MDKIKDMVHTCYNCGNTGLLKFISLLNQKDEELEKDEFGNVVYYQIIENIDWFIFQCPVCMHPVIISKHSYDGMPENYSEINTAYPVPTVHYEGVPKIIRDAFDAAVKTKGIDNAICLLSLRRSLEMICKDKHAVGISLENMIDDLIAKKILPDMLNNACWIIRQLGNEAAHADETIFYRYEVNQVIEYVAMVIDYLYSAPVRIANLKAKIQSKKSTHNPI